MGLWKAWRQRAAYARLVAQVSEHDVIRTAEEIVGTAWIAGLEEAEKQAAARHAQGCGRRHGDSRLRQFVERERVAWEQAERMRRLEVLHDRNRLAAAARALGPEDRARLEGEIRDIPMQ